MENNTNPNENMGPNMNPAQPENNAGQSNPVTQNNFSAPETKDQSGFGPIIGVIIILAIILIGGIYYFMSISVNLDKNNINDLPTVPVLDNPDTTNNTEDLSATIETQSSSDDLDSIETDLNSFGGAEIDQATAY